MASSTCLHSGGDSNDIGLTQLKELSLVNAGLVPVNHPRRFYKYALLDPLDQPFATFRYYYRSWSEPLILPEKNQAKQLQANSKHLGSSHFPEVPTRHPSYLMPTSSDLYLGKVAQALWGHMCPPDPI